MARTCSTERTSVRGDIPRDMDGTAVHDCLSKYFTLENVRHGVCNQHLIRELKAAHEIDGEPWAAEMKVILYEGRDLAEAARNADQDAVDPVAVAKIERRYEACYQKATFCITKGKPPLPLHFDLKVPNRTGPKNADADAGNGCMLALLVALIPKASKIWSA